MLAMFSLNTSEQNVKLAFACRYQTIDLTFKTKMKIILRFKLIISNNFVNEKYASFNKVARSFHPATNKMYSNNINNKNSNNSNNNPLIYLHTI